MIRSRVLAVGLLALFLFACEDDQTPSCPPSSLLINQVCVCPNGTSWDKAQGICAPPAGAGSPIDGGAGDGSLPSAVDAASDTGVADAASIDSSLATTGLDGAL